jgi:hypothetical protein
LQIFELKDQKSNFDFKTPPLMRITLIQLKEGRFRMFWTSHHILFDGWSKQILVQELLTTYDAISSGKLIEDTEIDQFEDFIKYLERINHVEEKKYWQTYLKPLEQSTLLPFVNQITDRNSGKGTYLSHKLDFDFEKSAQINAFAQKNRITLNTLVQGVWALFVKVLYWIFRCIIWCYGFGQTG